MAKKKPEIQVEANEFMSVVDAMIYRELARVKTMKPLLDTLSEFGITGVKALSFISRYMAHTIEREDE